MTTNDIRETNVHFEVLKGKETSTSNPISKKILSKREEEMKAVWGLQKLTDLIASKPT